MSLPTDPAKRKALPIWTGVVMYFPDALAAIASVSLAGNDQHNPDEPLHWARGKSTDQMNTAMRHMMDHGLGNHQDTDGTWHLAKAIWRLCAELQLAIEKAEKENNGHGNHALGEYQQRSLGGPRSEAPCDPEGRPETAPASSQADGHAEPQASANLCSMRIRCFS